MNTYQENGYANRREYLKALAADNAVPEHEVVAIAELLGEVEDFDGLVTAVEDRGMELEEQ